MIQPILVYLLMSLCLVLRDLGYKIISVDYPYFETNYFNKKNLLKLLNHKKKKFHLPFHGSVMFFICTKRG